MNPRAFKTIECTNESKCKGEHCIYYHTAEEKEVAEQLRKDPDGEKWIMKFMFYGARLPLKFGHVVSRHSSESVLESQWVPSGWYGGWDF